VALHENGDWVLAAIDGFYAAKPATGETRLIAAVEADKPGNRMNDGYVDARGRFWAGTLNMEHVRNAATLYRLDADGSVRPMITGVSTSNGIDWSPDNRTAYYVDTPTGRIDAFDFDLIEGVLSNRRPFVEIAAGAGSPDGLIVDAEGFVWLGLWKGAAVRRYSSDGRLDREIPMPAAKVTKCAFGGPDLDELFYHHGLHWPHRERTERTAVGRCSVSSKARSEGKPVNRFREK
jgi:sugar lactone lactonase YvrE